MPPKVPPRNAVPPARPEAPAAKGAKSKPEKPEAKPKAKGAAAKGKAGGSRGRSASKNKAAVVEAVVVDVEQGPSKVERSVQIKGLEVTSGPNLPRKLLEKIAELPFVAGYSKLRLERVSFRPKVPERPVPTSPSLSPARSTTVTKNSDRNQPKSEPVVPAALPQLPLDEEEDGPMLLIAVASGAEPSKPRLLRVGPLELLEEEAESVRRFQEAYGPWSPAEAQMTETRWKYDIMELPLAGGRCLLPAIAEQGAFEVASFSQRFADALSAGENLENVVNACLKASQLVCSWILTQPILNGCEEQTLNLAKVFNSIDNLILGRTHPQLGAEYYDGMASDVVERQIGGPTSDGVGIPELNKMVSDLIPGMKQTRPSQFLVWFHGQTQGEASKWNLPAWYSKSAAPIDFDCVLQDDDGQAWLSVCSTNSSMPRFATAAAGDNSPRHRHVFARLASWLLLLGSRI